MGDFKGIWISEELINLKLSLSKTVVLSMIKEMQPFHASNNYIADKLNIKRRTVSRIISELHSLNLITIQGLTSARTITIDKISLDSYRQNVHSTIDKMSHTLDKMSQTKDILSTNNKDSKYKKEYKKEADKEKVKTRKKYGEYQHVLLTDKQYENLKTKVDDVDKWIKTIDESIQEKGNIYHIKDFNLAIQKWYKRELKFSSAREPDYNRDAVIGAF